MNNIQNYEFSKKIISEFSGKNLTGNGGLLLMGEFMTKINLEKLLTSAIKENLNKKVKHSKVKVIIQKIYVILAGYTTDNIDVYIKNDPVFVALLGKVVPKTTVNRIINSFGIEVKEAIQKIQLEIERFNIRLTNKKHLIIDVDTSFDEVSEKVQNSSYNTHYGTTGYSPILAFDGLTGDFIMGDLRPGNFHCSKDALEFIIKIVDFYEENKISMSFRFDSGFANPEIYEYLESKGIKYYIKLKSNNVLKTKAEEIADISKQTPGKNIWLEFQYKAGSWDLDRRVVCSIDWIRQEREDSKNNKKEDKQYSLIPYYSFIVTNDTIFSKQEVFSMYNGRATIETLIEESKNGFMMDRLSHSSFEVNSAVFQIHLLTIQIFQLFRKITTGEKKKNNIDYYGKEYEGKFEGIEKIGRKEYSLLTIQTFRLVLFSIPTIVVKTGRKLLFRFEQTFGGRNLYDTIMSKICLFPKLEVSF